MEYLLIIVGLVAVGSILFLMAARGHRVGEKDSREPTGLSQSGFIERPEETRPDPASAERSRKIS